MFGWNFLVYWGMYLVGTILMFTVCLCIHKKFDLTKSQALFFAFIAFLCDGCGAWIMGKIFTQICLLAGIDSGSKFAIYGAVILTPILLIISARILFHPWRKVIDMIALCELFARAFGKLGCLFEGCCWGIECSFGFYNKRFEAEMFPSPLFEFIVLLIIILIGFRYTFKSKRYIPGAVYPITTILYASTRFIFEFFRYYRIEAERHIILGMTFWQFISILAIILSVVWLLGLKNDWAGKIKAYAEAYRLEKSEAERKERAEKRKAKQKSKKR